MTAYKKAMAPESLTVKIESPIIRTYLVSLREETERTSPQFEERKPERFGSMEE